MKDRFSIGFYSGVIAGIPSHLFNWGSYYFHLSNLRWADFIGVFVFGRKPLTLGETVFATVKEYFFLGTLGIVFALIIPKITSKNYLFKGVIFSFCVWFLAYAVSQLFKVPEFSYIPLRTALSNYIGAVLWGLSLAFALKWFGNRMRAN